MWAPTQPRKRVPRLSLHLLGSTGLFKPGRLLTCALLQLLLRPVQRPHDLDRASNFGPLLLGLGHEEGDVGGALAPGEGAICDDTTIYIGKGPITACNNWRSGAW